MLLPAPFWPTIAHTSPAATDEIDAVDGDRGAERLADAAHLEARRGGAAADMLLQPSIEVGPDQLLDLRLLHVRLADDADAGVDPTLDLFTLDVR